MPEADRIRPDVQELVDQLPSYPGRTSVLPYSVAAESVIYNVQMFEENGIEVPTTWDELIAACETLEAAGITPIYSTFKEPWTVAQGLFDYTVGGSIDVAGFYDEMNELGTEVGPDTDVSFQKTLIDPVDRMLELAAVLERRRREPRLRRRQRGLRQGRGGDAHAGAVGPRRDREDRPRSRARNVPAADDR